jgi:hypothetical protein
MTPGSPASAKIWLGRIASVYQSNSGPKVVRWTIALLGFGALFAAYVQFAKINSPYEGWDEVGTFNNASVMWSPLRDRTYTYGFLDTAKMALGRRLHEGALQPGTCMGEPIFSNNVPASLSESGFNLAARNSWIAQSAIDFNYFRGLTDRRGLYFARLINIAFLFLLVLGILFVLEKLLGGSAMALGALLVLWLMTGHEFMSQAWQALPNAANTLLALMIALLSGGAALKGQWLLARACDRHLCSRHESQGRLPFPRTAYNSLCRRACF